MSALRTHNARADMTLSHANQAANALLSDCGDDLRLAKWVLGSVAKEQHDSSSIWSFEFCIGSQQTFPLSRRPCYDIPGSLQL